MGFDRNYDFALFKKLEFSRVLQYASGQPRKLGVNAWNERNENDFFLAFGLGKGEGVDGDSRHGIGHVDIEVGSCICLSVCLC